MGAATLTSDARAEFKRCVRARLDSVTSTQLAEPKTQPETDEPLEAQAALIMQAYLVDPVSLPETFGWMLSGSETWGDMLRLEESGGHLESFRSIGCPLLMIHGSEDPHPGEMIRRSLHAGCRSWSTGNCLAARLYPWLERGARGEFYAVLESWASARTDVGTRYGSGSGFQLLC